MCGVPAECSNQSSGGSSEAQIPGFNRTIPVPGFSILFQNPVAHFGGEFHGQYPEKEVQGMHILQMSGSVLLS